MLTFSMSYGQSLSKAEANAAEGVKTVYNDGREVVKTVYADGKILAPKLEKAIEIIAKKLKVTADSLWDILVKQQIVWSWCYLFGVILSIISWGHFYYRFYESRRDLSECNEWKNSNIFIVIISLTTSIFFSVISITHFGAMMTGFLNPEYSAMTTILDAAKSLK